MKWAQSHTYLGWAFGDCCGPGTVQEISVLQSGLPTCCCSTGLCMVVDKGFSGRHVIPKSTQLLLLMLRIMSVVGLLILVLH